MQLEERHEVQPQDQRQARLRGTEHPRRRPVQLQQHHVLRDGGRRQGRAPGDRPASPRRSRSRSRCRSSASRRARPSSRPSASRANSVSDRGGGARTRSRSRPSTRDGRSRGPSPEPSTAARTSPTASTSSRSRTSTCPSPASATPTTRPTIRSSTPASSSRWTPTTSRRPAPTSTRASTPHQLVRAAQARASEFKLGLCRASDRCTSRKVTGSLPPDVRRAGALLSRAGRTYARGSYLRGQTKLRHATTVEGREVQADAPGAPGRVRSSAPAG